MADDITGRSRDELINEYAFLAKMVAVKIIRRLPASVQLDDLMSVGIIGLIDAIDKYDATKSNNFKKYAEIRIRGAIIDELRSMDWVSRTTRRQSAALEQTKRTLRRNLGRDATNEEVASELGVDMSQYHTLLHKLQPVLLMSIDDMLNATGEQRMNPSKYLRDPKAVDPSEAAQVQQLRDLLRQLIDMLPDKQRVVISLYYFDALNLKEIGRALEVTESRVSQLHAQAMKGLKGKVKRHIENVNPLNK